MEDRPPLVKDGDEITDDLWNGLVRFVLRNRIDLGSSSGIGGSRGESGTALFVASAGGEATLAKLGASTIAARSSTTVHSGTVTFVTIVSGTLTTGSVTVTAWNLLNKTIAASSYVTCVYTASGDWVIVAIDDCTHLS
jgi:hypothetical protein